MTNIFTCDILSLVEFPMATTNANQALPSVVPASTIELAIPDWEGEGRGSMSTGVIRASPALLLMFIDALRSR